MNRRRFENSPLDAIDAEILRLLSLDARTPVAELARTVGLSPPSVAERLRRLEEAGVIEGYAARIDPRALGLPIAAYIRIRPLPGKLRKVAEILQSIEAVVECDRITGEDCFIARAHVESMEALEALIDRIIPFAMTNSSIIQSSPVPRRLPPIRVGR